MTWEIVGVIAAVIGVPSSILGLMFVARAQARQQAAEAAQAKQATYNRGVVDGKALLAPEVNLAKSERDDARRERDHGADKIDRLESRIEHLEDELRRRQT